MPKKVELVPYAADWPMTAEQESRRLMQTLKEHLIEVHHIGSTAIPGIHAKPIIDLMPVVRSVTALDDQEPIFRQLGYRYRGESGIVGRRYCTLDDAATEQRIFHVHCFASGSSEIERHLAFRDYLRTHPEKAREYEAEKRRCMELHPDDSHAYSDTNADWIAGLLPIAMAHRAGGSAARGNGLWAGEGDRFGSGSGG